MRVRSVLAAAVALLLFQAATLGVSDDEAYYWVLAQRPALGYAFHPPLIAWLIAGTEAVVQVLGRAFHVDPASYGFRMLCVRAVPVVSILLISGLLLTWLREQRKQLRSREIVLFLSLGGFFGLSWMCVPDLPLFLGWSVLFVSTWRLVASEEALTNFVGLFVGSAVVVLSKFSGILATGTGALFLLFFTPGRSRLRWSALGLLAGGTAVGVLPSLIWNAQHEWGAFAYQFRDRHTGGFSWGRGLGFWGIQLALTGPVLIWLGIRIWQARRDVPAVVRDRRLLLANPPLYALLWSLVPTVVFGLQPFVGEYKPHWAFIAWLPALLALVATEGAERWKKAQTAWGMLVLAAVSVAAQIPVVGLFQKVLHGRPGDFRADMSHDLQGWRELESRLRALSLSESAAAPVAWVGARYQTASQLAFTLGDASRVTLLPRDLKQRDEWPLDPTLSTAPEKDPVRLLRPTFFVRDARYDGPLELEGAHCTLVFRSESVSYGISGKWIEVQLCRP